MEWYQKYEYDNNSCRDPTGRRRGRQPNVKMRKVLTDTVREAKGLISKVSSRGRKREQKEEE